MSSDNSTSFEDEAYMSAIAEPKMVMDEVGADIDEHGHVAVTSDTATQDPFTARGCLANALDEAIEEVNEDALDADGKNEEGGLVGYNGKDSKLQNPVNDFRDEMRGEVEGTTDTPQNLLRPEDTKDPVSPSGKEESGKEPTVQMDKAVTVKDSLCEALDAIAMDSKDPTPDYTDYTEENASAIKFKAPNVPESLGGDKDKPDDNGLVYVTCDFIVDPEKYISNNYKPKPPEIKNAAKAGKKPKGKAQVEEGKETTPEEEEELSDLGTPEAKESANEPDEPTAKQEEQAAKDADKAELKEERLDETKEVVSNGDGTEEVSEEKVEEKVVKNDKQAKDEFPEMVKVVWDYATFIDGSSFCCFDEVEGIDYTKITMDAGVKKPVTRETCETTFAQCRAQNPLFCRFHGPKLLEADIKQQIRAYLGKLGMGCVVSVTKDKGSKEKFKFRLTVGCPPALKDKVEKFVHLYMTQQPGISSAQEKMKDIGTDRAKLTQEFDMDLLMADKPPKSKDTLAQTSIYRTQEYVKGNKVQPVVGDTPEEVERLANEGQGPEPQSEQVQEPEAQPAEQPTTQNEEVAETVTETETAEKPTEQETGTKAEPVQTEQTEQPTQPSQTTQPEQTAQAETQKPTQTVTLEKPSKTASNVKAKEPSQTKPKSSGKGKKGGNAENLSGVKFSFAAYGEMPNEDPETRDTEPGGAGDIEGAELLSYASSEGVLKMPKGMLDYLKDLDLWKRAMKRGGKFNGQLAHDKNKPQMSDYGVEDPMADWIEGFMDGGTRTKNKRLVQLVFGKKYHEGGNDENLDDAPERVQRLFEEGGRRAVVEALLDAKGRYDEWVDKYNSASLAAKNKAESGEDGNGDFEVSFDQLAAREADEREMADRAYDEAVAEVWDFGADSPTIQYFSPEQMQTLKKGDRIRFDHAEDDFEVLGYDKDTDTLTVAPFMPENLTTDEDKDGWSERYLVTPDGIRQLAKDEVVPSAGVDGGQDEDFSEIMNQMEVNENESEINESPNADRSGDEVGEVGGGETSEVGGEGQGGNEPAEPESQQPSDFSLESLTPEEDKRERDRIKQRNEIKRRQEKPLEGGLGEMNQTLLDLGGAQGEDDLFNQTQKVEQPKETQEPQKPTEADIGEAAKVIAKASGYSVSAIKKDIASRLDGEKPVTKPVLDFVARALPKGNPILEAMTRQYENGGVDESVSKAEHSADIALSGNPTQAQTEAANKVKESVATAKEQNRIADEITERIGTMKGADGLGNALAKSAMESAAHGARDKAHKAEKSAVKAAEKLSKANEESYRDTERVAKGKAAAKVEKALTAMAQAVFPPESKSDSISDEADSIAAEVTAYAKEKGCESCDTTELTDAVAQIKKSSDRFDTMMGVFRHSMDSVGVDFHAEDIGYLAEDIGNEARSLGGQMEGLRKTAKSIKERIDKAAELAAQRAKLEKKVEPRQESATPTVEKPKEEAKPETKATTKTEEPKDRPVQSNGGGNGMDSRIEGIYKDWVEEEIPEWVKALPPEESKKYADMLEAARDWDSDEANTAFEELTKYENAKSKEYEDGQSKAKEEKKRKEEAAKAESEKAKREKEKSDSTSETEAQNRKYVMEASKRLGVDAFKPMKELKRMLGVARQLSNRDKRMEQRAKDLETMIAHAERMSKQAPQEGGKYAGDEMPKELRLRLAAEALVRALMGSEG